MSGDWQVGDLALCVANRLRPPFDTTPSKLLRIGAIYTVTAVRWSHGEQCLALGLAEVQSRGPLGHWRAWAFRKIRPHTPDAEDRETIALLTGNPVAVPA